MRAHPFSRFVRQLPVWTSLIAALALAGCDSDSNSNGNAGVTQDAKAGDTTGGDTTASTPLASGAWFLGVQAAPFGDLKLSFQIEIESTGTIEAGGTFSKITIRAVAADGSVSEPLKSVENVTVAPGGAFSALFTNFTLPGSASPTGTDIALEFTLVGTAMSKDNICGDLEGQVPAFEQDLKGSKFSAAPFASVTPAQIADKTYASSCNTGGEKVYDLIETCPQLKSGTNTFTSAERSRTFEVVEPAGGAEGKPLVLLYHGVGGNPKDFLAETKLAATFSDAVVIAPSSERDGSGTAVLKTDWYYGAQKYDRDNPDLVFFDDLVKCASAQYKTSSTRIYVTGMSGGGLMSTFLGVHRSGVVAAAAPWSGGYLHKFPSGVGKVPFLISWGGPTDTAYSQNFDTMAKELRDVLLANGNPVVECDHGEGHKWTAEATANTFHWLTAFELGKPAPDLNTLLSGLAAKSNCKVSAIKQ